MKEMIIKFTIDSATRKLWEKLLENLPESDPEELARELFRGGLVMSLEKYFEVIDWMIYVKKEMSYIQ